MDAQLKAKWIEALRSGEYVQERNSLYAESAGKCSYCCIGVGYVACIDPEISLPGDTYLAARTLDLDETTTDELIKLNDRDKKSFPEIADWIEQNL